MGSGSVAGGRATVTISGFGVGFGCVIGCTTGWGFGVGGGTELVFLATDWLVVWRCFVSGWLLSFFSVPRALALVYWALRRSLLRLWSWRWRRWLMVDSPVFRAQIRGAVELITGLACGLDPENRNTNTAITATATPAAIGQYF